MTDEIRTAKSSTKKSSFRQFASLFKSPKKHDPRILYTELLVRIASYLSPADLYCFALACYKFNWVTQALTLPYYERLARSFFDPQQTVPLYVMSTESEKENSTAKQTAKAVIQKTQSEVLSLLQRPNASPRFKKFAKPLFTFRGHISRGRINFALSSSFGQTVVFYTLLDAALNTKRYKNYPSPAKELFHAFFANLKAKGYPLFIETDRINKLQTDYQRLLLVLEISLLKESLSEMDRTQNMFIPILPQEFQQRIKDLHLPSEVHNELDWESWQIAVDSELEAINTQQILQRMRILTRNPNLANFEEYNAWLNTQPLENTDRMLDVNNLNLTRLPRSIGKLVDLRMLCSISNYLTSLPPEIALLVNLKYLYLNENQIIALPPEIGSLVKLLILSVTDNELTTLPQTIGFLNNLGGAFLVNNNPVTFLPKELYSKKDKIIGLPASFVWSGQSEEANRVAASRYTR